MARSTEINLDHKLTRPWKSFQIDINFREKQSISWVNVGWTLLFIIVHPYVFRLDFHFCFCQTDPAKKWKTEER